MWRMVSGAWKTMAASLPAVGVVAAIQMGVGLVSLPFVGQIDPNNPTPEQVVVGLLLVLVNFFLFPLIQSGYLSVAKARASGVATSTLADFGDGLRQWYVRLLGFEALITAVVTAVGVVVGIVSILLTSGAARMGTPWEVVTMLLIIIPVAAAL